MFLFCRYFQIITIGDKKREGGRVLYKQGEDQTC